MVLSRVLILSDSLNLPRATPDSLLLEETWPYRLRYAFEGFEFWQVTQGGVTTTDLLNISRCWLHSSHSPSWMIVQVGIVDWAPRAFKDDEVFSQRLLAKFTRLFPSAGKAIFEALRRRRQITYVDDACFRANVRAFRELAELHECSLIWVPVLGAGFYENILPGVSRKIREANQILDEELGGCVLDVRLPDNHFMSDGHHLKPEGHAMLLEKISTFICNG
ncbi:hypothetical protein [Aquipseudomonas alcaligenes]|uniref:hypothetical protein n=1 Tax=Aquipseudomonas alcaligenes TaxID=43263 RepID=UPI0035B274FE